MSNNVMSSASSELEASSYISSIPVMYTYHTCRYRAQRIVSLFNMNIVVSGSCESVILSVVTSRPGT